MAEALLLTGANVVPTRLTESGFRFAHPTLEGALRHLLGRSETEHAGDVAS
jgi:NAD dependent epimerase/dehydratase family enzyme